MALLRTMQNPEPLPRDQEVPDSICFAQLEGGLVAIRVTGRGSFANSVELKQLCDRLADQHGGSGYRFIIDLHECSTMDSTFLGVLASIGLRQKRDTARLLTVVNANEQVVRLLETLGLSHFLEVRAEGTSAARGAEFVTESSADVSREDRIIHMLEAHQNLCDIDSENYVRFGSVLKYLQESLEREKGKP